MPLFSLGKLLKSSSLYFLSSILLALVPLLLLPLLTRGLGVEGYGELTKVVAYTAILAQLATFGLDSVIQRKYFSDKQKLADYILLALIVVPIIGGVFLLLLTFQSKLEYWQILFIYLVSITQAFQSIALIYFQSSEQSNVYIKLISIYVVLNLIFSWFFLQINPSVYSRLLAILLSHLCLNILAFKNLKISLKFSEGFVRWILNTGWQESWLIVRGVVPNYIGAMLILHDFKFFTAGKLGDAVLGEFYANMQVAMVLQFGLTALTSAINPRSMFLLETGKVEPRRIWRYSVFILPFIIIIGIASLPIIEFLFKTLISRSFTFDRPTVQILILAFSFQAVANFQIPAIYRKERYVYYGLAVVLIGLLVVFYLNVFAINTHLISVSFLIGYVLQFIFYSLIACHQNIK